MAATENVRQLPQSHNSGSELIVPSHGVVTLLGYGIQVRVDRGHLLLEDGIGPERRCARLSRVGHGLRRIVVVGSSGIVSLAALRWLSDQKASFVMLERDGSVLATTGPVRPSDVRLRRAQALAQVSGAALRITRELIRQKITGQERVARNKLLDTTTADRIATFSAELATVENITSIRLIEAQAASAYWSVWRTLPVTFPKKDLPRVPAHWFSFGTRISPLTGSPRLAVTPACAMMNYLYALLEAEASLAARALGLDAAMGIFHVDQPNRDSLACDLMEPVRPLVDAYLLDWITTQPLKREWFFEKSDGNARLMSSLTEKLSETAPTWGQAVAPVAEWVAQALWNSRRTPEHKDHSLPTRLTQRRRSEARGSYLPCPKPAPKPERICHGCGRLLKSRNKHCAVCATSESSINMREAAKLGRIATHSVEAEALRAITQRQHAAAIKAWEPSTHPQWLTEEAFLTQVQPALRGFTVSAIASALRVSLPYATQIRQGRRRPHPRHWEALAYLAGISGRTSER